MLEIDREAERIANERAASVGIAPRRGGDARRAPVRSSRCFVEGTRHGVERSCESRRCSGRGGPRRCVRSTGSAGAAADQLRLVPDRRDLRRDRDRGRGGEACPTRTARRARAARRRSRAALSETRARARCRATTISSRANFIRGGGSGLLDRRLGVRRHGRPLLRPRQLRRQQRARRGRPRGQLLDDYFGEPRDPGARRAGHAAPDALHVATSARRCGAWSRTAVSELDFDFDGVREQALRAPRCETAADPRLRRPGSTEAREPAGLSCPTAARCVIIGGGVGGQRRVPPGGARAHRCRARRTRRSDQRLDVPLGRAGGAAARTRR